MLGPGDLRLSLGLLSRPVGEEEDPEFLRAVDRLVEVSQRRQKPLLTVSFKMPAGSKTWITKFNLLLVTADFLGVVRGHRQDLANIKGMINELTAAKEVKTNGANGACRGNGLHSTGAYS